MKATFIFMIAAAASVAATESIVEARPPLGSRGCAMWAVLTRRTFLEVGLPHLMAGR